MHILQLFEILLIVCLFRGASTNLPRSKLFVMPHEVKFLKIKDWLQYIDTDENYSYGQAEQTCLRLKLMSPVLFLLSVRTTLPSKGEFWIPSRKPMVALNGTHKFASEREDLTQRKGIICQAPLEAAQLVYRNGTLLHLQGANDFIPSYCYPQVDLSENDLDRLQLVMCLLLRRIVRDVNL